MILAFWGSVQAQTPIRQAHAHNDYMNDAPLFDALDNGFTSIEIDVCLDGNNLKVSHNPVFLGVKKTLEEQYLDPLREWIRLSGGEVYKGDSMPVILMIDLKGDGRKSYPVLHQVLSRYEDILTVYQGDSLVKKGPLQVCVSGSRPVDLIVAQEKRYVTIDGSINSDVYSDLSPHLLQRVSDPYGKFFRWKGIGPMPRKQKQLLHDLVDNAHRYGRQIRFYATENSTAIWRELLDAGADWINADDLNKFRGFYRRYQRKKTLIRD